MKSALTIPIVALTGLVLLLTSCAVHNGTYDSGVALTNNRFRVVGTAEGQAGTTYVLWIGGLGKDALVAEAKKNLYSRYPLTKGMILANVTVDFKQSFFFVAGATLVTVSGDVIDFNPANLDLPYKGFYTEDSTFFPMTTLPVVTEVSPKAYIVDEELNSIKKGSKISFKINNTTMKGVVEEINTYGIKCSYQTDSGIRKIYLKANNITVTEQ